MFISPVAEDGFKNDYAPPSVLLKRGFHDLVADAEYQHGDCENPAN